jgi:hypothetical protein
VFAAYPGAGIVNQAFVITGKIFTGAPEFDMPLPVEIYEHMNIFMREVPSDIVIIGFCCRRIYFDCGILAAPAAAAAAGGLEDSLIFFHELNSFPSQYEYVCRSRVIIISFEG